MPKDNTTSQKAHMTIAGKCVTKNNKKYVLKKPVGYF
jgi:hypothetical protein